MAEIKYRRNDPAPPDWIDYWIEVNGQRVGYVKADRASRQSGTISRWTGYDLDGKRIGGLGTYTFKSLKANLERHFDMRQTQSVAELTAASWAGRAREATIHRDESIRDMRDEGASLRRIAEVTGLSHSAVAKILAKETTEASA